MIREFLLHRHIGIILIIAMCLITFDLFASSNNTDENDSHSQVQCKSCHSFNKKHKVEDRSCLECHEQIQDESYLEVLSFHQEDDRQCIDCHTFHDTKYIKVDSVKFQFDFESAISKATCFACHQTNTSLFSLSDGHKEARKLYHSDFAKDYSLTPSQTCMVCHSNEQSSFELVLNADNTPLVNNHASHPYEIDVVRGKGSRIKHEIDPEIKLFNNRIECQTCHSLTTENKYLVVNSEKGSNFCNGCHEHNGNNVDFVSTP